MAWAVRRQRHRRAVRGARGVVGTRFGRRIVLHGDIAGAVPGECWRATTDRTAMGGQGCIAVAGGGYRIGRT
eukprot:ctg_3363.g421